MQFFWFKRISLWKKFKILIKFKKFISFFFFNINFWLECLFILSLQNKNFPIKKNTITLILNWCQFKRNNIWFYFLKKKKLKLFNILNFYILIFFGLNILLILKVKFLFYPKLNFKLYKNNSLHIKLFNYSLNFTFIHAKTSNNSLILKYFFSFFWFSGLKIKLNNFLNLKKTKFLKQKSLTFYKTLKLWYFFEISKFIYL